MKKYKVIVLALLIWMNIFTAIYFAHTWTKERQSLIFYSSNTFYDNINASNYIKQLNATHFFGSYDRIDIQIMVYPYYDNSNVSQIAYNVFGITILHFDNYGLITLALAIIDGTIIAISFAIEKHTLPEEPKRRRRD